MARHLDQTHNYRAIKSTAWISRGNRAVRDPGTAQGIKDGTTIMLPRAEKRTAVLVSWTPEA